MTPLPSNSSRRHSLLSPAALAALLGLAMPLAAVADPIDILPSSYSLTEDGYMPIVKNQGNLGTCWAFSNTSAYVSSLMRQGIVSGPNDPNYYVSPWHLATANGNITVFQPVYDPAQGRMEYEGWGGFNEFAVGYWTRGQGSWEMLPQYATTPAGGGPVLIQDNPHNVYPIEAAKRFEDLTQYAAPANQPLAPHGVRETISYQWDGDQATLADFQESLKAGILKYGGMSTMVFVGDDFDIDLEQEGYISPESVKDANHAITLVGWDDTKEIVTNDGTYTGGWLLQNSWSTQWGTIDPISQERGYFWIPFADLSFSNAKRALALVTRTNEYIDGVSLYSPVVVQNQIFAPYAYDEEVYVTGSGEQIQTYGAQRFVAPRGPSQTTFATIGLWQPDPGMTVSVSVYEGFSPKGELGPLLASINNYTMNPDGEGGYQEIDFDNPFTLDMGDSFVVIVDFGDENEYPIAVDVRTPEQLAGIYHFGNLSWMSFDGEEWIDIGTELEKAGVMFMKLLSIFTPVGSDGIVSGLMQTYGYENLDELIFQDGSELYLNGPLTITDGFVSTDGRAELRGGNVVTPNHFIYTGPGNLTITSQVDVGGDAHVTDGVLHIGNRFDVAGNFRVQTNLYIDGFSYVSGTAGAVTTQSLIVDAGAVVDIERHGSLVLKGEAKGNGPFFGGAVANDGFIGGTGFINAHVFNSGVIAPGFSPGKLVIAGNYHQASTGTYHWESAGEGNFDRIIVGGTAYLNGRLSITDTDGYTLRFGDRYRGIIKANKIEGSFSKVITPDGIRARLTQKKNSLNLLIAPESYTQLAATPNEHRVAKALDQFIPASGGDRYEVSYALDSLRADEYGKAFQSIMPSFYQGVANTGVNVAISQTQHLSQRLDALRYGAPSGYSSQGISQSVVADSKGNVSKEVTDILIDSPENRWGVWTQATGVFAKNYSITDVPNYHYNSGGFLVGADYRWAPEFTTGAFVGYQGTEARYPDAGKAKSNTANFGLYAAYGADTGFHANGIVMGGVGRHDVRREIDFGSIDRTANSKFDAWSGTALLETGYAFRLGNFRLGPIVSAQYTKFDADDFTETNAKSLNLKLSNLDNESFQTNVGARISAPVVVSSDVVIVPELRATWNHEYLQDNASYKARLDGGRGQEFRYDQTSPSRDSLTVGAGVMARFGSSWNANAFYNANCASSQSVTHSVSLGLGYSF